MESQLESSQRYVALPAEVPTEWFGDMLAVVIGVVVLPVEAFMTEDSELDAVFFRRQITADPFLLGVSLLGRALSGLFT